MSLKVIRVWSWTSKRNKNTQIAGIGNADFLLTFELRTFFDIFTKRRSCSRKSIRFLLCILQTTRKIRSGRCARNKIFKTIFRLFRRCRGISTVFMTFYWYLNFFLFLFHNRIFSINITYRGTRRYLVASIEERAISPRAPKNTLSRHQQRKTR